MVVFVTTGQFELGAYDREDKPSFFRRFVERMMKAREQQAKEMAEVYIALQNQYQPAGDK
ncbi:MULTISPECIES: hypothetical protein [Pseudovibrio]|uniref:hypothetical protein n=1 Tax=Stappiaceae TaxID=2821832 RepID=UPI002365EFFE|nr:MULTISPECIES: hypothetical protein [Pseudovibrio]MDD7910334.1 hypothetical protein [Pseudovibrio exalbescens]MDX5594049.1 hypothetical protein [Pseudovibrio sp. SPO723]